MTHQYKIERNKKPYEGFRNNCNDCFGLCCVALYFTATDGFPNNKEAGTPCKNLKDDFRCNVHNQLREKGLKGCTAYDCLGAGQKVAQITFQGHDWRETNETSKAMFDVFLVMRQLQEMLWYLTDALMIQSNHELQVKINNMIQETESLTLQKADFLLSFPIEEHREKVNILLHETSELVRAKAKGIQKNNNKQKKDISSRKDLFGADLRKTPLVGADLRGAFLIAADLRGVDLSYANLIGADMRDTDIRGANLSDCIFLTQSQINTAKGDGSTRLPVMMERPLNWDH